MVADNRADMEATREAGDEAEAEGTEDGTGPARATKAVMAAEAKVAEEATVAAEAKEVGKLGGAMARISMIREVLVMVISTCTRLAWSRMTPSRPTLTRPPLLAPLVQVNGSFGSGRSTAGKKCPRASCHRTRVEVPPRL